jgi:DNA-binding beta-propeller fold protein YncE
MFVSTTATIVCWSIRPGREAVRRRRVFGQPGMTTAVRPTQVSAQTLASPQGIVVDPASNLYVADAGSNRVLIFPNTQSAPVAGMAAAFVIGQASFGTNSAGGLKAPADVAVDSGGTIYVADYGNNRVLKLAPARVLPLSGGTPTVLWGSKQSRAPRRTTIRRTA